MANDKSILSFDGVTLGSDVLYDTGMWGVDFSLSPGELLLLITEKTNPRLPIADAAVGITDPQAGTIRFLAEDWYQIDSDKANSRRGSVGRVFDDGGWISNLSVEENIVLAERHHTGRKDADIREEAAQLARLFDLPGIPMRHPEFVRDHDLQRAACIRAFLGKPMLLVLEQPTRGIYPHVMPPLMNMIGNARKRGSAVIWVTSDVEVWNDEAICPTLKHRMSGSQMLSGEEEC